MRILLAEDEKKVARFIRQGLGEEGYAVDVASDGDEALGMALDGVHDLIILDIGLPRKDGLQVLRELRQKRIKTPVLLLTVRATIEDKVLGLDSGADDYLAKPFAFQELVAAPARAAAPARRGGRAGSSGSPTSPLTQLAARSSAAGRKIELTSKEFALLDFFLRNPGRVLTRTTIIEHVWDYDFDTGTNLVDVYVNYLRKKIDSERDPKLIHTVRGVGYVLKAE